MHIPQPPPPPSFLGIDVHLKQYWDLLDSRQTDPYLPWDKQRRRPVPSGLSPEEYWQILRLSRRAQARPIPTLTDNDGTPFSFVLTDQILRDVEDIAARTKGEIRSPLDGISATSRDQYVISGLIEEAITSSQLEGAVTTRAIAKDMLRTRRKPHDKSEQMILNNYMAMQRIRELTDEELTPELVCELQRIVTESTLDDPLRSGVVQQESDQRVSVVIYDGLTLHTPPPARELPERLEALCVFANNQNDGPYLPGVLRAITVHFMMGYNHFFVDGNGRTARALFYWTMLHEGYWLAEFLTISTILRAAPAQYGRSFLDTEQDEGDLTYFFLYHLGVIKRAIDGLYGYIERKNAEARAAQELLRSTSLTHRQLGIMNEALTNPNARFTVKQCAQTYAVTLQTARKDLQELVGLGYLVEGRQGRQAVWSAHSSLRDRIRD